MCNPTKPLSNRNRRYTCCMCGTTLDASGAASHGDGDIFDEYYCPSCETIRLEIHATYCECEDCLEGMSRYYQIYD